MADDPTPQRAGADRTGADRTGETELMDLPCPRCGSFKLVLLVLTDEFGNFQHSYYVCTFYGRQRRERCGWHGWTVPSG